MRLRMPLLPQYPGVGRQILLVEVRKAMGGDLWLKSIFSLWFRIHAQKPQLL